MSRGKRGAEPLCPGQVLTRPSSLPRRPLWTVQKRTQGINTLPAMGHCDLGPVGEVAWGGGRVPAPAPVPAHGAAFSRVLHLCVSVSLWGLGVTAAASQWGWGWGWGRECGPEGGLASLLLSRVLSLSVPGVLCGEQHSLLLGQQERKQPCRSLPVQFSPSPLHVHSHGYRALAPSQRCPGAGDTVRMGSFPPWRGSWPNGDTGSGETAAVL